ncbi:MAG: hypothetical protein M3R24_42475 [Chloroflexota bacterium]|nr:hypothetical protein [Chloroflexota bacterium]
MLAVLADFDPYWRAAALRSLLTATSFGSHEAPLRDRVVQTLLAELASDDELLADAIESVRMVAPWCVGAVRAQALALVERLEISDEERSEVLDALHQSEPSS